MRDLSQVNRLVSASNRAAKNGLMSTTHDNEQPKPDHGASLDWLRERRKGLTLVVIALSILAVISVSISISFVTWVASGLPDYFSQDLGITDLRAFPNGVLEAENWEQGGLESNPKGLSYWSSDGGWTWSAEPPVIGPEEWEAALAEDEEQWQKAQESGYPYSVVVETPRGTYRTEGSEIALDADGQQEVVYSTEYLSDYGNDNFQVFAKRSLFTGFSVSEAWDLAYEQRSGNVVANLSIQGVVVGTPDGNWTRVAVGPYEPTDFSPLGKILVLFGDFEAQLVLLSLGAAFAAVTLVVVKGSRPASRRVLSLAVLAVACLSGGFLPWVIFISPEDLVFPPNPDVVVGIAILGTLVTPFFFLLGSVVFLWREGISKEVLNDFSVCVVPLSALLALLAIITIPDYDWKYDPFSGLFYLSAMDQLGILTSPLAIAGLAMALVAIWLMINRWREELPVAGLLMVGLYLLANLVFLFGVHLADLDVSKFFPAVPVALAAGFFAWRLRRSRNSGSG